MKSSQRETPSLFSRLPSLSSSQRGGDASSATETSRRRRKLSRGSTASESRVKSSATTVGSDGCSKGCDDDDERPEGERWTKNASLSSEDSEMGCGGGVWASRSSTCSSLTVASTSTASSEFRCADVSSSAAAPCHHPSCAAATKGRSAGHPEPSDLCSSAAAAAAAAVRSQPPLTMRRFAKYPSLSLPEKESIELFYATWPVTSGKLSQLTGTRKFISTFSFCFG